VISTVGFSEIPAELVEQLVSKQTVKYTQEIEELKRKLEAKET
jgi:hypothetical protein